MPFVLDNAKYPPTYVTIPEVKNLSVGDNPIVDITRRRLKTRMLRVQEFSAEPKKSIYARYKNDDATMEEVTVMSLDHTAKFDLYVWYTLNLSLHNATGAAVDNFAYRYGYWVLMPTVADKLLFGVSLLEEREKKLAEKYDIEKGIEDRVLPLPLYRLIEMIFKETAVKTITWNGDVSTAGVTIGSRYSPAGHILVLKSIAADKPPDATYTTSIKIAVDEEDFLEMRSWSMSGATCGVPLFVPVIDKLDISMETNKDVSSYNLRLTYAHVKLTEFLKMVLGLIEPETNPEVAERIRAGVGPRPR